MSAFYCIPARRERPLEFHVINCRVRRNPVSGRLDEWLWSALDLLSPPDCAGCGRTGSPYCRDCLQRTELIQGEICSICGAPDSLPECAYCAGDPSEFDQARAYAAYSLPFKSILLKLKYRPDASLAGFAARLVSESARPIAPAGGLIIPVPLSAQKQSARGYNQAALVARPLAALLGLQYFPSALRRVRETRSQVGLGGDERRQNLARAFRGEPGIVEGRQVLLVDDVFTTGATGNACALALKQAGAAGVSLFTLARALRHSSSVIDESAVWESRS